MAADAANPHTMCARPTTPADRLHNQPVNVASIAQLQHPANLDADESRPAQVLRVHNAATHMTTLPTLPRHQQKLMGGWADVKYLLNILIECFRPPDDTAKKVEYAWKGKVEVEV